jgi:O-antigen ligase
MKLDLSRSNDSVSLLEPLWILEPLWVFAAMLLFLAGPKKSVWIATGLALLALSFLQRWVVTSRPSRPTVFDVSWALLLVGALLGLWASYDASLSLPALLTLIGSIALYYVVANAPKPTVLAWAVLLVGSTVAVYFVTQYQYISYTDKSSLALFIGGLISRPFPRLGAWEPFPNSVATLLEGLIPLSIALTVRNRSWGGRAFGGAVAVIIGLAVLVAASRGAWVALLAAGVLWLVSCRRGSVIAFAVATIVVLAALGGYLHLVEGAKLADIPAVGSVLYQFFARPDRLKVYQGSLRTIQDFPLTGIGLGEVFALVYSKYVLLIPHAFLTYSHNLYLTIWLGHGLLGILGVGWLVLAFGYLVVRESREGGSPPLFQAACAGVVVILVHGLFDARQYVDWWTMWPLFVLLGLAVSSSTVVGKEEPVKARRTARSQQWRWVTLFLLAVGCAVMWRPLLTMTCVNLGTVKQAKAELAALPGDVREGYLRSAIVDYERTLKLAPDNRTANLRLGNLAVADGRYEEGVAHLEIVWRASPEDQTARKALGLAYAWVGEIDRAAELLKHTKDIVAELNVWGWWHGQEGRQQVSMNAYRTSLALKPDQPRVRNRLATFEGE